jgi:sugar (pentulose or hexulose) kinase
MTIADKLVVGLDSSTQSTKAVAWDRSGRMVAKGSAPIATSNPCRDQFVQDPSDWWQSCCEALRSCLKQIDVSRIDALAIAHQRETVAFLNEKAESIYPAIVWLDERSRANVVSLSESIGVGTIHRITGRYPDLTPTIYKFDWMRRNEPEIFAKTACFADVQCYLAHRLTGGPFRTGCLSADSFGIYDIVERQWSPLLLDAIDLSADRLPATIPPGTLLGTVNRQAANETGVPEGLPIFTGGGDGAYAGLGTDCTRTDRAYVNLGTAVVSGAWSPEYRYDRAWRTLLAAQGEGYVFESVLRTGAFLVNWFVDQFVPEGRNDSGVFDRLEAAARDIPIGCDGLMIQPYWSGVMDPYWDVSARGVTFGQSGSHKPAHFYRAILEGITLDQVMRTRGMEIASGQHIDHYVAIGGGAESRLWRQMLSDASGKRVLISDTVEASALGAGMTAAFGAGWFPSIAEAAHQMTGDTKVVEPNAEVAERYGALLEIYEDVYDACSGINRRMVNFARDYAKTGNTNTNSKL